MACLLFSVPFTTVSGSATTLPFTAKPSSSRRVCQCCWLMSVRYWESTVTLSFG